MMSMAALILSASEGLLAMILLSIWSKSALRASRESTHIEMSSGFERIGHTGRFV
jgi:hypothetical protein